MDQTTTPQLRPEAIGPAPCCVTCGADFDDCCLDGLRVARLWRVEREFEALRAYYAAHPPLCVGRANDRCARCGCPLVEAQREPVPTTQTWDHTAPEGDVFDVPAWHYEPGHGCERGHCHHPAPPPAAFDDVRQLQEASR